MKIIYDYQAFSMQSYGGISRYFCEIINEFNNNIDIEYEIPILLSNNYYINSIKETNKFFPNKSFKGKNRIMAMVNKNHSKRFIKNESQKYIFHPTYYDPYFLELIGNNPFILTIHDMIHEIYKGVYFDKDDKIINYKKTLALKAKKIIAISENTKNDIIRFYGIEEEKIEVVYHGTSLMSNNIIKPDICNKFNRYVLFVGQRKGYKNFENFIKSMKQIILKDNELNIICAGGGSFDQNEKCLIKDLEIEQNIFQYSFNDSELAFLYKNALAFVFPSLYEGFGIPILEAFACNCPQVISNSSCFPEIAGDAAEYFNPNDIYSMVCSISNVIYNKQYRKELINKGNERLKFFSWKTAAQKTKDLYEELSQV